MYRRQEISRPQALPLQVLSCLRLVRGRRRLWVYRLAIITTHQTRLIVFSFGLWGMRQCRNQTARVQVLGPGRPAYVARSVGRKNSASPISGGPGNDTDFYITADICTQTVNFSF